MIYEYECAKCEGYYEVEMKLAEYEQILSGDVPPPGCAKCGKPLKKVILKVPTFKLLGNGWFDMGYQITDMEMNQNQENDKRLEDKCMSQACRDDANVGEY